MFIHYYEPAWFGQDPRLEFVDSLFAGWQRFARKTGKNFNQFPGGYNEWALTGHLALGAWTAGFYPRQEYLLPDGKRLDLHITQRESWLTCGIEIKPKSIQLDEGNDVAKTIREGLSAAWHDAVKRPKEMAKFRCGLLGVTVQSHTGKWEKLGRTARSYTEARQALWSAFQDGTKAARSRSGGGSYGRRFCCGCFGDHRLAKEAVKWVRDHNDEAHQHAILGMLWAGIVKQS